MTTLKSQTVEREKTRRRKRVGIGGPENPMGDMMDPGGDNDDDDDDDIMPPPTPGGPGSSGGSTNHKDGDIVKMGPNGEMPQAPEGFTIVTKENGVPVLRKRRYRDLKKVGIGGFQAKTRTPSRKPKGTFFSKVKLSFVISTTFEFSRQNMMPKYEKIARF